MTTAERLKLCAELADDAAALVRALNVLTTELCELRDEMRESLAEPKVIDDRQVVLPLDRRLAA